MIVAGDVARATAVNVEDWPAQIEAELALADTVGNAETTNSDGHDVIV